MAFRQDRNDELVYALTSEFQARDEPNFAWKSVVSMFLALPGLRALWPMSAIDYTNPQCLDIAGGGYHLTNNNSADFAWGAAQPLVPMVMLDGTNQYLSRADGGAGNWADITGTEAYILTVRQGLTFGGWFWFDDVPPPAAQEILIGKRTNAAGNYSYWLRRENGNGFGQFHVSNDGTAVTSITSNPDVLTADLWWFVWGRFDNAGNLITLGVNDDTYSVAFNNTIFDGNADFCVGSLSGGGSYLDGRASMCFLCACTLSDTTMNQLWQWSRAMFGR